MVITVMPLLFAPIAVRADDDGWPSYSSNPFDKKKDRWSRTWDQNDRKEDNITTDAPERNSSLDNEWGGGRKQKNLSNIQSNQLKSRYDD